MASYSVWNEALREHFFADGRDKVYLALDDSTIEELWQKIAEAAIGFTGTGSGVEDFSRAVREDVRAQGWLPDRAVECLGRCCLFVLAYSRIPHRDGPGAPAYRRRLRELLGFPETMSRRLLAPGLDQVRYQENWALARDEYGIELPPPSSTNRRRWTGALCNIRLVRSQAALRRLDLAHVRELLLDSSGGRGLARSASEDQVIAWINERSHNLRPYAKSVWERNPEVAWRQVLGEWRDYLGTPAQPAAERHRISHPKGNQQQRATGTDRPIYLQLDSRRRLLLAWRGLDTLGTDTLAAEVRHRRRDVWVFDELYEAFFPHPSATPGDRALLFIDEQQMPADLPALNELSCTVRHWRPGELDGPPDGWSLVDLRDIRRPPPANRFAWVLTALALRGGLRVAARRWLFGAGPRVYAPGTTEVEVNGRAVPLSDETADLSTLLPGSYEVRGAGRVEAFEIVTCSRGSDLEAASRWVWPRAQGWPELSAATSGVVASLDGPLFYGCATRALAPGTDLTDVPFLRRRPTCTEMVRAIQRGDTLALAAAARGRA